MTQRRRRVPSQPAAAPEVASSERARTFARVKLVKQQINGDDHIVLKRDATVQDLESEAKRLASALGYEVKPDRRRGTYVASHPFFQGKFVLRLLPDE